MPDSTCLQPTQAFLVILTDKVFVLKLKLMKHQDLKFEIYLNFKQNWIEIEEVKYLY